MIKVSQQCLEPQTYEIKTLIPVPETRTVAICSLLTLKISKQSRAIPEAYLAQGLWRYYHFLWHRSCMEMLMTSEVYYEARGLYPEIIQLIIYLWEVWPSRSRSVCMLTNIPLSIVFLPHKYRRNGVGYHGTSVAKAMPVHILPNCSAHGKSRESLLRRGPYIVNSSNMAYSSIVLRPSISPWWLSLKDSQKEWPFTSGGRNNPSFLSDL